ncbi:hypothetical protein BH09BAC3_BH09BAC3_13860 [soil metagenome]
MKKFRKYNFSRNAVRIAIFILVNACVDPINFNIPVAELNTTIEGMITDGPGPYIVKVSEGVSLSADSVVRVPVQNARIKLYDDQGNVEDLTESSPGDYQTGGVIRGKVGHSYYIRVETSDGKVFESEPDVITPVGNIEAIKFEYEARVVEQQFGAVPQDVFRIYIDSKSSGAEDAYVRWRFTGTYKVLSYPERHWIWASGYPLPDPYPCSGINYSGQGRDPVRVFDCTCCTCWARQYESQPQLSDAKLVKEGQFNNILVGTVPINSATFYDKYLVEIEQMSLSKKSFDFFKSVRAQKEGASSLFQPPSGEIKGNIKSMNSTSRVVGIFWATSISSKSLFIRRSDVPYLLTPIPEIRFPCTWYPYATNQQPKNWE